MVFHLIFPLPFNNVHLNFSMVECFSIHVFFQVTFDLKFDFAIFLFGFNLCPSAGCGYVALLCLFKRSEIDFCTLKFLLKCGAETAGKNPSCTSILIDMEERFKFIETLDEWVVEEGEIDKAMEKVEKTLLSSNQRAGLLCYWTDKTGHCVTVYATPCKTKMQIEDNQRYRTSVEDPCSVRNLALMVLTPAAGKKFKTQIEEKWYETCGAHICKDELNELPRKFGNSLPQRDESTPTI